MEGADFTLHNFGFNFELQARFNIRFHFRFAWYPIAHDRGFISTGAFILKARFNHGLDPRDQAAKGVRDRLVTFGFVRPLSLQGLE